METTTLSRATAVCSLQAVTKVYRMGEVEVHALRGVDFELYEGELAVLLGPSGSGKSTLLNILGALDVPTDGRVFYRDDDLTRASVNQLTEIRRARIGFVFQFYNLIPSPHRASENVRARRGHRRGPDGARRPRSPASVWTRSHGRITFQAQLSGGEQQRVAIARAIAKRPEVLLCDEPTGALDIQTGKVVLEALQHVNDELGTAAAVITHNAAIARMAHRVVQIADGRIANVEVNTHRVAPEELAW